MNVRKMVSSKDCAPNWCDWFQGMVHTLTAIVYSFVIIVCF